MARPSARLSVFSRELLLKRAVIDGWPTATVAEQLEIGRTTVHTPRSTRLESSRGVWLTRANKCRQSMISQSLDLVFGACLAGPTALQPDANWRLTSGVGAIPFVKTRGEEGTTVMRTRFPLGAISALVLVVGGVAPAAAVDPTINTAASGPTTAAATADAIRFRSTMGLPSDAATIEASLVDRVAYSSLKYGAPLTDSESKEMDRRVDVQAAVATASEYVVQEVGYGGIYIDQPAGGIPVFLFTSAASNQARDVARLLPPGIAFRLETVRRSYDDLLTIQAEIDGSVASLHAQGIDILLTGIDERANQVVVGVDGDVNTSAKALDHQYGSGVRVRAESQPVDDACSGAADCPPLKGGIEIVAPDGGICTSGYIGKRADNAQLVVVTAGHCLAVHGGSGDEWHHASGTDRVNIGLSQNNTWVSGANADVGLIGVYTASRPSTKNLFMAGPPTGVGGADIRSLTSRINLANQHVGDTACRMGRTSGRACGSIYLVNVDRPSVVGTTSKTIHHMVEVDFDSTGGDSGGPYYFGSEGLGIHVHSQADAPGAHGWYSPLDWTISEYKSRWGVTFAFCLTSAC